MRFKKHFKHMTKSEVAFLKRFTQQRLEYMKQSNHFLERIRKRAELTDREVLELFTDKGFDIIESHNAYDNGGSFRVVIRSKKSVYSKHFKHHVNYIIVLDVLKNIIVTFYTNEIYDTHPTLDEEKYYNYEFKLYDKYGKYFGSKVILK